MFRKILCKILKHKYSLPKDKSLKEALTPKTCVRCGHTEEISKSLLPYEVYECLKETAKHL